MERSFVRFHLRHVLLYAACMLALISSLFSQNPVVTENALPGNPRSEWEISGSGDPNIQGFATDISVNRGETVRFKIKVNGGGTYSIRIYRLGYYQGNGARLVANLGNFTAVSQPEPVTNVSTGWVDCGNWSESASWAVPFNAVSGVYIARLTRTSGSSHIVFIVRDDAGNAPILFKTSDATWQAYNGYGGSSLYVGTTSYPAGHAVKVSYNRPFMTRDGGAGGDAAEDWLFNAEYPMIRFLERNGYHVSYTTDVDMERSITPITPDRHKIFMSVGHDEYWSAAQRTRIENARNAGVHLAFFSGNEVYWKTRWEDNGRTLVCYKEGTLGEIPCGTKCDPSTEWTGLWRDGCSYPNSGGCRPENALTGQISWAYSTGSITVPGTYRNHRFWRNTGIASLAENQTATLPHGMLGYEWDYEQYPASYPGGRIVLSNTILNGLNHKLSLYRHSSGALVFGAGTVQWSWGLDNVHDRGNAPPSPDVQQATINLLADMGVQPGSLMSGMTPASASTDFTAPVPVITSPVHGSTVNANTALTITGTCSDAGGVVAGVEISVDGGNTWNVADGTTSWTYSWTPTVTGTAGIRVRGFDDSGNMSVPGATGSASHITFTVSGGSTSGTFTIFQPSVVPQIPLENDGSAISLGVKFRTTQNGFITGIRYYKGAGTGGTRTGTLWSSTGTRLAEVVFTNETASGWQQAMFAAPVAVNANTTYVASYHSSSGDYCSGNPFFTTAVVNGPLRALANGEDGNNGVYLYSATPSFPTSNYGSSNYYVDVVFNNITDTEPPVVNAVSPASGSSNVSRTVSISAVFSEDMLASSIGGSSFELRDAVNNIVPATVTYNPTTRTATLTPSAPLAYLTSYTARVLGGASGVKDMAGNALANTFTWSFVTLADLVAPTVTEVSPVPAATAVNVNTSIAGTFSEAMDAGTINNSTVLVQATSGGDVTGAVSYNAVNSSFSFVPAVPLQALTNYTVTILGGAAGAKDMAGNPLAANYSWAFTTEQEPDLVPPVVESTSPASNATGIALNAVLSAVFNEDMLAASINSGSIEVRDAGNNIVPATVTYNAGNRTVSVTPATAFSYLTSYSVRIKSGAQGVKDAAGNALASDYTWSFTTVPDQVPPQVTSTSPASGATGIAVSATVTVQFNEAMDPASINTGTVELRNAASALVTASVTYNPATRIATLQPQAALQNAVVYTLIVKNGTGGVKDVAGNPLASVYVSYFTTTSGTISIFPAATVPPQFKNDGTALVLGMKFRSTQAGQVVGVRFYKPPGDNGVHTGNLWTSTGTRLAEVVFTNETASGWQQAFFSAPVNIAANTTYVIAYHSSQGHYSYANPGLNVAITNPPLRALASGEDGPNGMYRYSSTPLFPNANYQTSNYFVDVLFGAVTTLDQTAPVVSSVLPAASSTGISLNPEMRLVFNEAMNFASISTSSVELRNAADVLVPVTVTYDAATRAATLTASGPLQVNTTYRIIARSGANGVKDVAGNPLAADYISSFTTLADQTPPLITSTIPVADATGVDAASTVTIQFNEAMTAASISAGTVLLHAPGGITVPSTVSYDAGNLRALLQPATSLQQGVTYSVTVLGGESGVKDLAGVPLAADYTFSFTTLADLVPPSVTQVSPVPGATGVALSVVATVQFSEPVDPASLGTGVITWTGTSEAISFISNYNPATNSLTLSAQDSLVYLGVYQITVKGGSSGVKDLAGNAMTSDYSWAFTAEADLVPPVVVNSTPPSDAINLPVNIVPAVQFSEAMDPGSFTAASVEWRGPGPALQEAALLYNNANRTLTIQPVAAIPYGTSFTVTIRSGAGGVTDLAGNPLQADYTWLFSTMAEPDLVPPAVSTVSPASAAVDVPLAVQPLIQFSEAIDATTVTADNFVLRDENNSTIAVSLFYDAVASTVAITPASALAYATTYTVVIQSAVRDLAGNNLVADYSWSFTTLADIAPPTVVSTVPASAATQVPTGSVISATFSEPLFTGSINTANVILQDAGENIVPATVAYDPLLNRITITPDHPLAYETVFTVLLQGGPGGIEDLNGNALAGVYTWSFTSEPFVDVVSPTIVAQSPAAGAIAVSTGAIISVTFSEEMTAASIGSSGFELRNAGGSLVPSTISYDGIAHEASLTPVSPLSYLTTYNVRVAGGPAGVKDLAGNAMVADFTWSFTTEADQTPPQVTSVIPAANAMDVVTNAVITVAFSEPMLAASVTNSSIELRNAANVVVPSSVVYSAADNSAALTPLQALAHSAVFTIVVRSGASGVRDLAGNPLQSDHTSSFTTVADLVPPSVTSVSPSNGATGVPVTSVVTVLFSEDMNATSIHASTVELRNSGNVLIPSSVAYNSSARTVTLTPHSSLSSATVFTVRVRSGESGVKDLAGNALAADYTWSFTSANTSLTIFQPGTVPAVTENDGTALTLGMKFRSSQAGFITGIRYYKPAGIGGTRTGNLWSSTGTKLAEVVFTNETSVGWQQMNLNTPVAISANTTYVVSYHSSSGDYVNTNPFFTTAVVNGPLRALANGEDGGNGLYRYTSTPAFPNSNYMSSNYWVDVVFTSDAGPDLVAPSIVSLAPGANTSAISIAAAVRATFNETVSPASFTEGVFELRDASSNLVPATLTVLQNEAALTPGEPLLYTTSYTAYLRGGVNGVKDVAGNALARDTVWTFTTSDPPPPPITGNGPGGPILVLYSPANPFSRYAIEILRAEGLNYFMAKDIAQVETAELNSYDMIILGEVPVNSSQVTMLTDWVTAGGTLVAFRPSTLLSELMGITRQAGALSDQYLLVNTTSGPGQGIVDQTIQFHGTADLYTLSGAASLATLYSSATASTSYPAVTLRQVGTNGGKAVAFTYDLARSIVYTRQGNPAWAGQKRDGTSGPIRSDDLFFGGSSPDWINLNKVAIPQADEQQRLLINILLQGSLHRKPLPRFWFLPKGLKAAVVMTGDDHANEGTTGRFNQYLTLGPNTPQDVADWNAIRGTSYIYTGTPISNAQAAAFEVQGFEISLHLNTGCANYTPVSFETDMTSQLAQLAGQFPGISAPVTHRTHCLVWSDWATTAKVQAQKGIRLDVNYYYWPASWVQNRSGMFTGSGMPMRFADVDGSLIDCYQAATQMTDESGIALPQFSDQLLDRALGAEGYYGVFVANMHTDTANHIGSNRIIASALARNVPVISAKQLLTWLDGRNNSYFGNMTWSANQLSFPVTALAGARNLKGMLPVSSASGNLVSITRDGNNVAYTTETIKGINYAFFDIPAGTSNFIADYGSEAGKGMIDSVQVHTVVSGNVPGDAGILPAAGLSVQVMPNPSGAYFQLQVRSGSTAPVAVRIADITGSVLERHEKLAPVTSLHVGDNWKNGTYFVEIIQGTEKKVLKLVKIR